MSEGELFSDIESCLGDEHRFKDKVRDVVQDLEQCYRALEVVFQGMHRKKNKTSICSEGRIVLDDAKNKYKQLIDLLSDKQYYRYLHLWQGVTGKLSYASCLIVYLESNQLATRETVAEMLGIKANAENGFHLCLDDYLCGLLFLAGELSRWSVNCVTIGDTKEPLRIFEFVGKIDSGFRLLNLKNDFLRKRYDGLKYDMKRIEQVVYDLSIRGINK
uniref:Translin n=1 Tax=Phallusia mammillata TaxID=59560 RepID=A0A6F9DW83_9ASCI|nr:translin-like [Phallusia mammillata]